MANYLSFAGPLLLLLSGFMLLALSQDRHRRAIGAPPLGQRLRMGQRICGYALLLLALPLLIWREGPGFGTLLWGALLSVCAHIVTFTLAWKAGWLARFTCGRQSSRSSGRHSPERFSERSETIASHPRKYQQRGWPIGLAALTLFGLLSALIGEGGVWWWLSWAALAMPLLVIALHLRRPRARRPHHARARSS